MKNFAKLTIFFTLSFVIFFLVTIFLKTVTSWIDIARIVSAEAGSAGYFAEAIWIALPAALYFSILFALAYSAKENIPIPLTIICIAALGFAFAAGVSKGIARLETLKPIFTPVSPIQAGPGLLLSRSENTIILLKEINEIRGPRLVSIPGQPLIYQEVPLGPNNTILSLPSLPFRNETPWFLRSVGIDFTLSAGEFKTHLEKGNLFFAAYAFSLILLLASLRFLLELSQWPLANIFLGALVFRFILSLEIFLNSREINALIFSFLAGRAPSLLITPLIFGAMSILTIIFTLLSRIARNSGHRSERNSDG
jgi:hypothetical protein